MTDTPRYTAVAITLHWILAALLLGMVFFGWYMEDLREGLFAGTVPLEEVQQAYNLHKTTGMAILVLSLVRLAWRLTHKTPGMPEGMKPWEKLAAHAVHWAFYVLMIGMPIMGWISASASELPSFLFNNPDMPLPRLPVPQNESLHEVSGSIHGAGGWPILILFGLHAAAALKHQFFDRDGLLARMIPVLKG
ncbi:cytochrome b [Maricaulis virginensis]|uniref:Cytochrome b n=1 Tax=Maricaulis virginensis TaxID=144022 RepID=A0A9W6MMA1_9PROT|nr:cytochrome b [Maricaulis virginensis]GLK50609.1 cytochrome b [Maricaulis virginensis]